MIDLSLIGKSTGIKRFSGTILIKEENIAEHSYEMCLLAINFCKIIPELDEADLLKRIVVHDLEEIACGIDIPSPFKHYNPELNSMINKYAYEVLDSQVDKDIYNIVVNAKDNTSNGWILGLIDKLQCHLKIGRETYHLGNKVFIDEDTDFRTVIDEYIDRLTNSTLFSEQSIIKIKKYSREILNYYK